MRRYLPNHFVATAFELGWSELSNGELLATAETQFDEIRKLVPIERQQWRRSGIALARLTKALEVTSGEVAPIGRRGPPGEMEISSGINDGCEHASHKKSASSWIAHGQSTPNRLR
jgi:hypothetical protein